MSIHRCFKLRDLRKRRVLIAQLRQVNRKLAVAREAANELHPHRTESSEENQRARADLVMEIRDLREEQFEIGRIQLGLLPEKARRYM